jgi:hypothetical protein
MMPDDEYRVLTVAVPSEIYDTYRLEERLNDGWKIVNVIEHVTVEIHESGGKMRPVVGAIVVLHKDYRIHAAKSIP